MIARLFGRLMRGVHAGEGKLIWNHAAVRSAPETIVLTSSAFHDGAPMPTRFAATAIGGENQSPPLQWSNLPSATAEIALVMEDPAAPLPVTSLHVVATGLPPGMNILPAGSLNRDAQSSQVRLGKGLMGRRGYYGPMPPPSSWSPSLRISSVRARSGAQNGPCSRSKKFAERNGRKSSGARPLDRYF
jgi:phosphatidylethanolamine-binding protein (PEBP) family uncharacterized protein